MTESVRRYVHEDGRECWKQGGRWYFRKASDELATVTDAKPFVGGCERSHEEAQP